MVLVVLQVPAGGTTPCFACSAAQSIILDDGRAHIVGLPFYFLFFSTACRVFPISRKELLSKRDQKRQAEIEVLGGGEAAGWKGHTLGEVDARQADGHNQQQGEPPVGPAAWNAARAASCGRSSKRARRCLKPLLAILAGNRAERNVHFVQLSSL